LVLVISWTIATHRSSDGSANNLAYTIPNIRNTFVKTLFKYQNDLDKYEKHSSGTTFLFPLAKWAGGIYLGQQFRKDTLQGADLAYVNKTLSLVLTTLGWKSISNF
jgi:hypothetical protein